ncbi:MAG: ATP-binding protein [Kofleriaceae bacterium]
MVTGRGETWLDAHGRVLEMIVGGQPLPEVLAALCEVVVTQLAHPQRAVILLPDAGIATAPIEGVVPAWSVSIRSAAGVVLGTLATYARDARPPEPDELRTLEMLARTAALAIERDRTDRVLHDAGRRHEFLTSLAAATQPLAEPTELMATTARLLAEHLDVDRCAYANIEDETVFDITGDYARDVPSIVGRWPVAAFGAACVEHMRAGTAYVVVDSEADPRIGPEDVAAYRATTIRAVVCVPLHKQGVFTAAMAVHQRTPRRWTPDEIGLIGSVVARCWEALERARATRALQDSEARYRTMVEASPDCVKLIGADGMLLQINPAGLRMIEADAGQPVIGRSIYDVVAPEHREAYCRFNERVCSGHSEGLGFDVITLGGQRRTLEVTAVPLPAPGGGFMQLGMTRDVSQRVAAQTALTESRARLDYAVRLSGVGFWYCDLPFNDLEWDARVKQHFFLGPDARVTIDTFYDRMHPEDREPTRVAIDVSITNHSSYDVVYRTVDPASGAIKWIRALGGAMYTADGTPLRFDGVTVDVTANAQLNHRLRDQDRLKDEFLATLAHELRNPLAPIRTGLSVLQHGGDEHDLRHVREMMSRQLGHLVRLVDDLLDISRVTLGKVTLVKQRLDFRSVLDSALETARPLVEANGHELVVQLASEPMPLEVDPTRIAQVIANLLSNAAKYTPRGGRIEIGAKSDGTRVSIHVSDNGVGIPGDLLPRVFEMFMQATQSIDRSQGGLGIGLTLVRNLVKMHGGTVEAHSPGPGHGSTFTVTLPLDASAVATVSEAPALPVTRGMKILVVDDNIDGAETLAMLLELTGNETRMAHTGRTALAVASEFHPDVVLLDIGLPELDGYEVARHLRSDPLLPQPLLVALTGWGSDEDRQRAQHAGFDRHMVKPVDSAHLAEVLASVRPRG